MLTCWYIYIYIKDFIYLFLERREGRERGRRTSQIASCMSPTGDLVHNLGMCPDWELNQWTFGLQNDAQSTELYQSGLVYVFLNFFQCGRYIKYAFTKKWNYRVQMLFHLTTSFQVSTHNFPTSSISDVMGSPFSVYPLLCESWMISSLCYMNSAMMGTLKTKCYEHPYLSPQGALLEVKLWVQNICF